MPCVIILRDRFYDIIVHTDDDNKIQELYDFGLQLDAGADGEDDEAPLNLKIFEMTRELWITSGCALFKDEAEFNKKFPNREVPMRLSLEQSKTIKWSQGIVYAGIRYFGAIALNLGENQELVPERRPEDRNGINEFNLMKHYMNIVGGRR